MPIVETVATKVAATEILLGRLVAHLEKQQPGLIDALAGGIERPSGADEDETRFRDLVDSEISLVLGRAARDNYGRGNRP